MEFHHISSNPAILGGKPCIKNTRISVQILLEWIASGASTNDIIQKYPHLSDEAIKEAILYASHFMSNEIILEIPAVA